MEWLRDILLKNAYSLESQDPDDGGPLCADQMTNTYRFTVILITVIPIQALLHYIVYTRLSSPYVKSNITIPSHKSAPSSKLEIFLGILEVLTIILQFITKAATKRLIFMMSPCHMITLAQSFLLLSTHSVFKEKLFVAVISWTFAPTLALIFPTPGNITLFGEELLFWIQHYLCAIICPLVLILSGRYTRHYQTNIISILYVTCIQGWHTFWFYQRFVLAPISMLTWANINFTLCVASSNNYYWAGEVYVMLLAAFMALLYFNICKFANPKLFSKDKNKIT